MDRSKRKSLTKPRETSVVEAKAPRNEQSLLAKRESDRVRGKTRINIGRAFERWREFRDLKGFRTDPELAFFLLDR